MDSKSSGTLVALNMRVIANGVSLDGTRLRATLVVSPRQLADGQDQIDLEEWPREIVEYMAGRNKPQAFPLKLRLAPFSSDRGVSIIDQAPQFDALAADGAALKSLSALWREAITRAARKTNDPWSLLRGDIEKSASGGKQKPPAALTENYPGNVNEAGKALDPSGALATDDHGPGDPIEIASVLPNPQTLYAAQIEAARAQRVIKKLDIGPYLPGDQRQLEETGDASEFKGEDGVGAANDAKLKAFKDRLQAMIDATDPSRANSKKVFDTVSQALEGAGKSDENPQLATLAPFAKSEHVNGLRDALGAPLSSSYADRAGHVYGSWPQYTRSYRSRSGADAMAESKKSDEGHGSGSAPVDSDDLARIHSIYFTLQGDALFSRLFGFAFDISFKTPKGLKSGDRVRLSAGDGLVWTEALYDNVAGRWRFWPAARDFGSTPPNDVPHDDQRHGAFRFDETQYLTAIDVRGAVSQAPDAVDRGSRHQTIGFTFLDGAAAARAARDLAIAKYQQNLFDNDAAEKIVLYAEELVSGRRVDAGVGNTKTVWRGLMNRFVDYPFLPPAARKRLDAVAAPFLRNEHKATPRILNESSFQRLARAMPVFAKPSAPGVVESPPATVEAIVEEAYLTWDGTPLAALACKSESDSTGGDPILPVARTYDLPNANYGDLRPPPLRYGIPYYFAMRAVYLGGGGPTIEEAQSLYAKADEESVLPRTASGPVPKRFLRHDAIAAPILLLPASLVENTQGPMGFEPPATAILRTAVDGDAVDLNAPDVDPPGPNYLDAWDRRSGPETYRVLVAPMAGLDFCARHGMFDDLHTWDDRLRGGLRDVEFLDELVSNNQPNAKTFEHLGFPVALVRRNTGFDADQIIYERKLGNTGIPEDTGDALGATIFKSLSAPDKKRKQGRGYLPDPAAKVMSLRVRVVDSDLYLTGDVPVDLYLDNSKVGFPQALPVVLKIVKVDQPSTKLARKTSDIIKYVGLARFKFSDQTTAENPAGVLVRLVRVELRPGEQFDIEATCLPLAQDLWNWFSVVETIGTQMAVAEKDEASANLLRASCGEEAYEKLKGRLGKFSAGKFSSVANNAPPDDATLKTIATELLFCIQNNWPLTEVAGVTSLRVAHAINAPRDPPKLEAVEIARVLTPSSKDELLKRPAQTKTTPVGGQAEAAKYASAPGATQVLLAGEIQVDLEQIDKIEINAYAVSASGSPFDDPARGRGVLAKRAGRWPSVPKTEGKRQFLPKRAVLGFDVDPDGKTTLLGEKITLLRIQNLPDPRDAEKITTDPPIFLGTIGRLTRLDLGALHEAALRGTQLTMQVPTAGKPDGRQKTRILTVTRPHEISDTRARHLVLESTGVARFARAFETAPMFSNDKQEHILARRRPLRERDQSKTSEHTLIPSLATDRPPPPGTRTPEIFFRICREASLDGDVVVHRLTRKCGVRLRFDRGWFSSGEGERIGIVLWPPRYFDQPAAGLEENCVESDRKMKLPDFNDVDLGDGGQFITRWGGDPIRKDLSPQRSWFIPPKAFACMDPAEIDEYISTSSEAGKRAHDPLYVERVRMPVGRATAGTDDSDPSNITWLDVSLLTFEPYFDIDAEEWFVDVPMSSARATDPFIRFGLVRYQANAIQAELQVSTPVRVWTQLPPRRHLEVSGRITEKNLEVVAVVKGQASDGVKDLPKEALDEVRLRLRRPRMQLIVAYEIEDATTTIVRRQVEVAREISPFNVDPIVVDGEFQWTLSTSIDGKRLAELSGGQFIAWVEEIEERLPASYPNEPTNLSSAYAPAALVRSGPRFLARIPFWPNDAQ